ncbi:hypothetical protein F5B21DRAFT_118768 [Xylaria acuta]|nr:hypothetical protein F5B21DRAFT_118768 [Xylaria acuta]
MAKPDAILDPDGDFLVILRNPSSIFDSHEEPGLREPASDSEATTAESNSDGEVTASESDTDEESEEKSESTYWRNDWRFKASSKHLSLACPRFRTMMDGPWLEATQIHDDGLRHWVLEGFELKAMIIVLSIIHGKHDGVPIYTLHLAVPQTVELNMLVEIARIVDYIECYEIMGYFAGIWIHHLEDDVPVSYNTELLLWICVAGVFRSDKVFERCTRVAIIESHSGIPTLGLPILPGIGDEINLRRERCLDSIFAHVYNVVNELTTKTICSLKCDAIRLGILAKYMHAKSLSPRPTSPYTRLSVGWAVRTINCLPAPAPIIEWMSEVSADVIREDFWADVASDSEETNTGWEPRKPGIFERESILPDRCWSLGIHKDKKGIPRLPYLHCGFRELVMAVHALEWTIEGLEIKDLGIRRVER